MAIIYALLDPETEAVRYVGKTTGGVGRRLAQHVFGALRNPGRHARQWRLATWIRSLETRGLRPAITVLEEDPEDLNEAERRWIAGLRRDGADLCNMTDGGDGQSPGYVPSAEARAKVSASLKGRVKSDQERANISAAQMGHMVSEETKQKIALAHLGFRHTDETKARMSASKTGEKNSFAGRTHSEESRQKIREGHLGLKMSEETKAKISAKGKGRRHTEEAKAKMREAIRSRHQVDRPLDLQA